MTIDQLAEFVVDGHPGCRVPSVGKQDEYIPAFSDGRKGGGPRQAAIAPIDALETAFPIRVECDPMASSPLGFIAPGQRVIMARPADSRLDPDASSFRKRPKSLAVPASPPEAAMAGQLRELKSASSAASAKYGAVPDNSMSCEFVSRTEERRMGFRICSCSRSSSERWFVCSSASP